MVEFMNYKRSIYITKIPMGNGFQRTVGFLTDVYNDEVLYKGQKMHQYEVLRKIALGMGYNVDEYSLKKNSDSNLRMPVSIVTYKCEFNISTGNRKTESNRHVTLGDIPVFEGDKLIGFISNGKFVNVSSYKRYADISKNHKKR